MGRKTYSYDVDTRNETNYRFEQQQKNLGTQLGGVIFSERPPPCPGPGRLGLSLLRLRHLPCVPALVALLHRAHSILHSSCNYQSTAEPRQHTA